MHYTKINNSKKMQKNVRHKKTEKIINFCKAIKYSQSKQTVTEKARERG